MLWTRDCGGNKTINLLSKDSTFSLKCFLEDYKNRNKKFNEWTKVAETLQLEIAQVTVTFSACNVRKIQACVSIMKDIPVFFLILKNVSRFCRHKLKTNVLILRVSL